MKHKGNRRVESKESGQKGDLTQDGPRGAENVEGVPASFVFLGTAIVLL